MRSAAYPARIAHAVRVQIEPVPLELEVIVVAALDNAPGLVVGDFAHPLQDLVRDVRPAVRQAGERIERRQTRHALGAVEDHAALLLLPDLSLAAPQFSIAWTHVLGDEGSGASP